LKYQVDAIPLNGLHQHLLTDHQPKGLLIDGALASQFPPDYFLNIRQQRPDLSVIILLNPDQSTEVELEALWNYPFLKFADYVLLVSASASGSQALFFWRLEVCLKQLERVKYPQISLEAKSADCQAA
jgi:hypothetical protein